METRTEERVHFILKDDPDSVVYTYAVDCTDTMPDCASANVDLMEQAIVWIETRTVVETPWTAEVEAAGESLKTYCPMGTPHYIQEAEDDDGPFDIGWRSLEDSFVTKIFSKLKPKNREVSNGDQD